MSGTCAQGFGSCCVLYYDTCGGTISNNRTYIRWIIISVMLIIRFYVKEPWFPFNLLNSWHLHLVCGEVLDRHLSDKAGFRDKFTCTAKHNRSMHNRLIQGIHVRKDSSLLNSTIGSAGKNRERVAFNLW